MIILGYVFALFVGIILGLLGGGGSILAVPVLVYIMGVSPVPATAYSLFIVGVSALVGTQQFFKNGNLNYKIGITFAIPSLLGVFFCRKWIMPNLPETINFFQFFAIGKDTLILVFFALVMILASLSMLFSWKFLKSNRDNNLPIIAIDGIIIGVITGFVGAGGGFLIIPALLLFTDITMKEAVGTSLFIIAVKSLLGFTAELSNDVDWNLLLIFTSFSTSGIFIGSYLSNIINGDVLKKSFGIFVFIMAMFIFFKELFYA